MTDLTIIQFMISGALLLALIGVIILVVHLRNAIEQLHSDHARLNINSLEYKQNLMGHLGRLENKINMHDQENKIIARNVKESLKRRPTLNQLKSVERNMREELQTKEEGLIRYTTVLTRIEGLAIQIECLLSEIDVRIDQKYRHYRARYADIETKSQLFDDRTREHCESTMGAVAKRLLVLEKETK